jgi:hypothetical protein
MIEIDHKQQPRAMKQHWAPPVLWSSPQQSASMHFIIADCCVVSFSFFVVDGSCCTSCSIEVFKTLDLLIFVVVNSLPELISYVQAFSKLGPLPLVVA